MSNTQSLSFPAESSSTFIYLTRNVSTLVLPLICSREGYCVSLFPHMVVKKECLHNTLKWSSLTLVTLKWCFAERGSFLFAPPQAPRSAVSCGEYILCVGSQEELNCLLSEGGGLCVHLMHWKRVQVA